jgi:hypothetical protein
MKKSDKLQAKIEKTLADLLSGTSKLSAEEKAEARSNVLLAIKWQSVKLKMEDDKWGSGFTNGPAKGGTEDAGLDDD